MINSILNHNLFMRMKTLIHEYYKKFEQYIETNYNVRAINVIAVIILNIFHNTRKRKYCFFLRGACRRSRIQRIPHVKIHSHKKMKLTATVLRSTRVTNGT